MTLKPRWWRYPCGGKIQSTNCPASTRSHGSIPKYRNHTPWSPLSRQLHLKSTLLTTWRTTWETTRMRSTMELCSSAAMDKSTSSSSIRARHGSGLQAVAALMAVTQLMSSIREPLRPSSDFPMRAKTCTMSTDQPLAMSPLIVSASVPIMVSVLTTCSFLRWTTRKSCP